MASTAAKIAPNAKRSAIPAADAVRCAIAAVPWRELTSEQAAWDRLADEASEPNPFFESWYLLPSLEAYDLRGSLRVLRFEHEGRLAGVLPLARSARYYGKPIPHLGNWQHDNMFLGTPLVAAGREVEFWHAMLGWADRHAGAALFLHLADLSLDGPMFAALEAVLAARGREGWIVRREERALLSSPLGADQYRAAALSAGKRKDLRRRMNRLAELGEVSFVWLDDDAGIEDWCDAFLALEMSGWKGKNGSAMGQRAAKRAIFTQGLAGAARRCRLLRLAMHLDGEPVAMLSTFLTPPGAFGYKTAFDERYSRCAPGVLIENEFLSALDQRRFDWCDGCASADQSIINDIWQERRTIGKVSIAIGGALRRQLFRQLVRHERGKTAIGGYA
jgi:CelD/BcsL family acetyltransferase involved in cellulose biosynthesis